MWPADLVELNELFNVYWRRFVPVGQTSKTAYPFFHLKSNRFGGGTSPSHVFTPSAIKSGVLSMFPISYLTYVIRHSSGIDFGKCMFKCNLMKSLGIYENI